MRLIQQGDFDSLATVVSAAEFEPLRPLILLIGWQHCMDVTVAKKLLKALGTPTQVITFNNPYLNPYWKRYFTVFY